MKKILTLTLIFTLFAAITAQGAAVEKAAAAAQQFSTEKYNLLPCDLQTKIDYMGAPIKDILSLYQRVPTEQLRAAMRAKVEVVASSKGFKRLAVGSDNGTARILERGAENQYTTQHIEYHNKAVKTIAMSDEGDRVITGSNDGTVHILEEGTDGKWLTQHVEEYGRKVRVVSINADTNDVRIELRDGTVHLMQRILDPKIKVAMNAARTAYNVFGLTPEQYALLHNLHDAYQQGVRQPIVLNADQLGVFKTFPQALRMFIKHKYNLTTQAFAKIIFDRRKDKKADDKATGHEGKEEKKAGVPQQAAAPRPAAAAAVAAAKAAASKHKS
jgi:hypothetical protein